LLGSTALEMEIKAPRNIYMQKGCAKLVSVAFENAEFVVRVFAQQKFQLRFIYSFCP